MSEENIGTLNEGQTTEESKTYTQEEVDKLLQAEADRRVTQALKKAEEKSQAKVKEAQKLAAMNESQKYEYELEQREKAIQAKEKELALSENKNAASQILADKGISLELVNFVVAEDAETMNANIKLLEKAFKASVKAEVEKRMGSTSPKQNLPLDNGMTKEAWAKLTIAEKQNIYENNREIYNQFAK